MVDLWYNEIKDYDFQTAKSKNGNPTGHFTQVVWKASNNLGCGLGINSKDKRFYGVTRYTPTGNLNGLYKTNVLSVSSKRLWFFLLLLLVLTFSISVFGCWFSCFQNLSDKSFFLSYLVSLKKKKQNELYKIKFIFVLLEKFLNTILTINYWNSKKA